jgi:hypothetical protein
MQIMSKSSLTRDRIKMNALVVANQRLNREVKALAEESQSLIDGHNQALIGAYAEAHDNIKQWLQEQLDECDQDYSWPDSATAFYSRIKEELEDD